MPVDPTISLKVTGGGSGLSDAGAVQASNPFTFAATAADTQNKINQNKAFALQLQAKQKLGQIMATSPDIPTAIQRAQQDPSVAAFVPELVQTIAGTQDTLQAYQGKVQAQGMDAFAKGAGMLPGEMVEPGAMKKNLPALLGTIPDLNVRASVKKSMEHLIEGLTSDLPEDPEERKKEYAKRVTAAGLGTGSIDALSKLWAQPETVNQGDVLTPGTRAGAIPTISGRTPGSFESSGNGLSLGLPPGMYSAEGMRAGGKYGIGSGTNSGGPNAAAPVDPAIAAKPGADGKPLIPPGLSIESPPVERSSFGVPIGSQAKSIEEMHKRWAGQETEAYQNAGVLLGQLGEMKHNLSELETGKGFLSPGSGAEFRLGVAKLGKLVEDVTGTDLGVDKAKIANAEDAMKLTQRLGISYLTSALGSQREAAETIRNITEKGIPGIQNTYLGSALMTDMIEAVAKRSMEEHEFRTIWQSHPKNRGNLTGADIAFNKAHPATDYINQALAKYGIDKEAGTISRSGLQDAVNKGLVTMEQAEFIRQNKGKIPADLPKAESAEKK